MIGGHTLKRGVSLPMRLFKKGLFFFKYIYFLDHEVMITQILLEGRRPSGNRVVCTNVNWSCIYHIVLICRRLCKVWTSSGKISALHSVVAGSISSRGEHGIHC